MSDKPVKFSDLDEPERQALLEYARLSPDVRDRMRQSAHNILWWEGFAKRVGRWAWLVTTLSVIGGGAAAAFYVIANFGQGIGK